MGWGGEGRLRRERISVNLELIYMVVQQKLTQQHKTIIFQFEILKNLNFLKEKIILNKQRNYSELKMMAVFCLWPDTLNLKFNYFRAKLHPRSSSHFIQPAS